jgi:HAMP domain-containing protein
VGIVILRWVFWRELGTEYSEAFYTLRNMTQFLVPTLILSLLLVLLVMSVAMCVFAVFASHSVAGPLFRLQRVGDHLSRMTLIGRIYLRQGDWLKPISLSINEWVEGRKVRHRELIAWAEGADAALHEAKLFVGSGDIPAARRRLAECLEEPLKEKN